MTRRPSSAARLISRVRGRGGAGGGVGGRARRQAGCVPIVALDRELARVAVASVDAHRVERDLVRGLRRVHLRDEDSRVVRARGCRIVGQEARRCDPGRHPGEGELDRLVLGDGLAERRALLRVAKRGLERGLGQADPGRRDAEPCERQCRRQLRVAAADHAGQEIPRRDAATLEVKPARVEAPEPERGHRGIGAETRRLGANDEPRGTGGRGRRNQQRGRVRRVVDRRRLAVEDPVLSGARGPDPGGERHGAQDFSACHRWEESLPLLRASRA